MSVFAAVLRALEAAEVRSVVVGGLAVVLHGHTRLTTDLDLVIDLEDAAASRAIEALLAAGLQPRLPVPAELFAQTPVREGWIRDKGMEVFSLWSPRDPLLVVDLFARHPLPFEDLWQDAKMTEVGGIPVRIASLEHLIRLKEEAGRPLDLADVQELRRLQRAQEA